MHILYNVLIFLASFFLRIMAIFNKKMKLFVEGRKNVFKILKSKIGEADKTIWFHCASLGEFEQGLPIMQAVKQLFPKHKIVVSFFSPSGFEIKKNTPIADCVVYLPLDTSANAKKFIVLVHPTLVLFVKYEFWPNYLFQLKEKNIPTLLISAVFRKNQIFFKSYGNFMRKALFTFNHIFVQDENSEKLLKEINFESVTISGDTRFDRVSHQIEQDNSLPFIEEFINNKICIVCGSTWTEDETVLIDFINSASTEIKFIIAPHQIESSKIKNLTEKILKPTLLYSEMDGKELKNFSVFIIDTIGLLTKIYSYADVAYVGGAMGKTGLHNILEPATFGVPIVIGKNYKNFPEAERLESLAGLYSVKNPEETVELLNKLVNNKRLREETGMIAGHFINTNVGATHKIVEYINATKF